MTSFYNLLKYAATGQASPDMSYYDRMRASTLMGRVVQTLTGIPPLSFKSDGSPLISWTMKGNGSQSGTPTPDNPVMPTFCGVRTGNLIDMATVENGKNISLDGSITNYSKRCSTVTPIDVSEYSNVTFSFTATIRRTRIIYALFNDSTLVTRQTAVFSGSTIDVSNGNKLYICFYDPGDAETVRKSDLSNVMLNLGSTALSYEPYGWKIPFENHGENLNATIPVYLGEVPTVRRVRKLVLTGKELWQKSSSYKGSFYMQLITDYLQLSYDAYCTHAVHVPTLSQYSKGKMVFNGGLIANCNLWFSQFDENTTVADFKSYLAAQYAAGMPVTVWYVLAEPETGIVNEPLAKIGDYADELSSEDAGVTIPTVKGQNTLTVDSDLQPSEMTITFKG